MLIPIGFFGGGGVSNSYEHITTVYGTGSSATVNIGSIPDTYKHLQLRMVMRGTSQYNGEYRIKFNNDSNPNYSWHVLFGDGGTSSRGAFDQGYIRSENFQGSFPGSLADTNNFAAYIVDIADYASTNKFKTTKQIGGQQSSNGYIAALGSGGWRSTSAITDISIINFAAGNWSSLSRFSLYGIKG